MEVTKQQALAVTAEIKEAVERILAEHGLAAPKVKTTYGDLYKLVIETSVEEKGAGGVNLKSAEAIYFTKFGFTAYLGGQTVSLVAPLGTVFTSKVKGAAKERKFAFAGIASKRPKFPIYALVLGDDGQPTGETMFFTENVIPKINASA